MKNLFNSMLLCAAVLLASCGDKGGDVATGVQSVTLTPSVVTIDVGAKQKFVVTITPDDVASKLVTWSSDNDKVATVAKGVVTGVAPGVATITATAVDGGKTGTCVVTVETLSVVGVWEAQNKDDIMTITFTTDGKYTFDVKDKKNETGRYSYAPATKSLFITPEMVDGKEAPSDVRPRSVPCKLTPTIITVTSADIISNGNPYGFIFPLDLTLKAK